MNRVAEGTDFLMYVVVLVLAVIAIIVIVLIFGGEGFMGNLLNSTLDKALVIFRLLNNG